MLTPAEIDRLAQMAKVLTRPVNPDERQCEVNLVLGVDDLEADDVRLARMLHPLGMSYGRLAQLRQAKRSPPPGAPTPAVPVLINLEPINLSGLGSRSITESMMATEAGTVQRGLRGRQARPFVSPDATLVDPSTKPCGDGSSSIAAHREFSLTMLAGPDGAPDPGAARTGPRRSLPPSVPRRRSR